MATALEMGLLLKDEADIPSESLSNPPARAPRPGFCTEGEIYEVRSNHFPVQVTAPELYKYSMVLTPRVKSRGLKGAIMEELVESDFFGGILPAFDGENNFYTAQPLSFEAKDFPFKLRNQQEVKVTIGLVDRVGLTQIHQSCFHTLTKVPQKALQALDVVLRWTTPRNYTTVSGRFSSLDLARRSEIGDSLECWKGCCQSLCLTQMGISLNVDSLTALFYKPVNVAKFSVDYLKIRKLSRLIHRERWQKLQRVLMGVRVEVNHMNEGVTEYNISGVTTESLRNLKFPVDMQGTMISAEIYFREQYGYKLSYIDLPCLLFGEDENCMFLPMEVCNIIRGQKFSEMLNKKQMTALLRATRQKPYQRFHEIGLAVQIGNFRMGKEFSNQFRFSVENHFVDVDARLLPAPVLKYHDTGEEKTCVPSVGQWNMIGKKVIHGGTVKKWACLSLSCLCPDIVSTFCNDIVRMCNNIGMVMNPLPSMDIKFYKFDGTVEENLRRIYSGFQGLDLLLVILPEEHASFIYKYTKTVCETQLGIVSQCCLPKTVTKASKRYLQNVALKINVKVGGSNTVLEKPIPESWCDHDCATIIFGVDVNHPPPGDVFSPSIAAVVASIGWPIIERYNSAFSAQQQRQEIISDLFSVRQDPQESTVYGGMIRELLIGYMKATSVLPQRIILYRGGVSEGQFSNVLLHELSAIRKACLSIDREYKPTVTFVVLQKRQHTWFFPERRHKDSMIVKSGNVFPGTVVDKVVCHPLEFDFYLCSHAVLQGTSRPTYYNVLFDENGFSANEIEVLTNNLCYTYARCTRSLSIVPPVQYAHLVATRARCYMETRALGSRTEIEPEFKTGLEFEPILTVKENLKEVMFYC